MLVYLRFFFLGYPIDSTKPKTKGPFNEEHKYTFNLVIIIARQTSVCIPTPGSPYIPLFFTPSSYKLATQFIVHHHLGLAEQAPHSLHSCSSKHIFYIPKEHIYTFLFVINSCPKILLVDFSILYDINQMRKTDRILGDVFPNRLRCEPRVDKSAIMAKRGFSYVKTRTIYIIENILA